MIAQAIALAAASLGPVVLRGAAEPDPRTIVTIDQRGVEVASPNDGPRTLLGWERVKLVLGDDAPRAEPFMAIADAAWRAETRLLRADGPLALPQLEMLAARLRDTESPTALLAFAGLARVRLDSKDLPGAIEAWRSAAALHARGHRLRSEAAAALRLDDATGLIVDLPIFWSIDPQEPPTGEPMLIAIAHACAPDDPSLRAAGRAELRDDLPAVAGTWREAWSRAAIGRSYLLETDPLQRDLGILELLHVPARFAEDQPMLTALALAEVLSELRSRGDPTEALIIEQQLKALDPRHPGLQRPPAPRRQTGGQP